MNSYQEQLELVKQGLAVASVNEELTTFKYSRRVMYDYLWNTDPRLLEIRGHTYNNKTGELVQLPFRKSFNYLEEGNWKDVPLDTKVAMYKKYNGFMAACSIYKGELLVSTTGTTNSSYADLAKSLINKTQNGKVLYKDFTYLFEIVDNCDPHIVNEVPGVYSLGARHLQTGVFYPSGTPIRTSLGEAIEITNEDRGEGFMVYLDDVYLDNTPHRSACKMKTPYYVGKKKLMRMNPGGVDRMFKSTYNRLTEDELPEMWKELPDLIRKNYTSWQWKELSAQERRVYLEAVKG